MEYKVKTDIISKDGGKSKKLCLANDNVSKGDLIVSIWNAFMRIEDVNSPEFTWIIAKAEEDSDSARTNPVLVTLYDDTMRVSLSIDDGAWNVTEWEFQGNELEKIVWDVIDDVFHDKYVAYKFVNYNGTVLQSWFVRKWSTPAYTGQTPTKEPTTTEVFTFSWWSPSVWPIEESATYTAQYTATERLYTVYLNTEWINPTTPFSATKYYESINFDGWDNSNSDIYWYDSETKAYYVRVPYKTQWIWNTAEHTYVFSNNDWETYMVVTPILKADTTDLFYEMSTIPAPIDEVTRDWVSNTEFCWCTISARSALIGNELHVPNKQEVIELLVALGWTYDSDNDLITWITVDDLKALRIPIVWTHKKYYNNGEIVNNQWELFWLSDCEVPVVGCYNDPTWMVVYANFDWQGEIVSIGFKTTKAGDWNHLREFTNIPEIPDSTWTRITHSVAEIYYKAISNWWLITVRTQNWRITIYSYNEWARAEYTDRNVEIWWWILPTEWMYYQWWNWQWWRYNKSDFPYSDQLVDASAYWPWNVYQSLTFIRLPQRDSSCNENLWWMKWYSQAQIEAHQTKRFPSWSYSGSYC